MRWTILALSFTLLPVVIGFADDRIWVKDMKINGKPVRMIVDTGSDGMFLTSDAVKRLGLKVVNPPTNSDFGDTAVYNVDWAGTSFPTDFTILKVPGYAASDFDGLIGWWGLHNSIFRIDGASRRITFLWHVPKEAKNWTKFLILTNSGTLDLKAQNDDSTNGIITVDTGAWSGIGLSPRLCQQWKDMHPHFPMTLETCVTTRGLAVLYEAFATNIDIGPLHITDVPILQLDSYGVFAPKRDGQDAILGMAALSRLDLVVDGPHNVVYLRAKTNVPAPYTYNRLGAVFVPAQKHLHQYVACVVDGSPAYDAGIRNGDILVQVDKIHPLGWTADWQNKFELSARTQLHFTLQRNGTNFETVATLRNILQPDDKEK